MIRVRQVRAFTLAVGADYHDRADGHWIDDHIASPMARYPNYRDSRRAFGIDLPGTLVVEVEAETGEIGFAMASGGEIGAWIVERHLARFIEDRAVTDLERAWDQMYLSTLHYGRRGVALHAISAVDLALWDLAGRLRQEPVYQLLGGAVCDEIPCYATGPRPDVAKELGFIGGKLPLQHGPAEREQGLRANLDQLRAMRERVGEDFWLAWDCWMSLDVDYAARLARQAAELDLCWLEEPLLPDDYLSHAELRRRMPSQMMLAAGEHEATRWGFQLLLEVADVDLLQPDVGWCGGLTELLKISSLAATHGKAVVPHASSVYAYHFVAARTNSPFAEFLMMHPTGAQVVPIFAPLLVDEPVPAAGRLRLSDRPGFGVQLNPDVPLHRPFQH